MPNEYLFVLKETKDYRKTATFLVISG